MGSIGHARRATRREGRPALRRWYHVRAPAELNQDERQDRAMKSIHCTTEQPNGYRHRIDIRAHELHADLTVEEGGQDSAPGAHDYFDASLAACRALTAMWFAKRNGIPLERVESHVERDSSEERKGRYK